MAHRIRYAMTQEPLFSKLKGTLEADETYVAIDNAISHASELTEVQARHCVNTDRSLTDLERRIVAHMIDSKWGPDPVRN